MVNVKILCGGYGIPAKHGTRLILCGQTTEVQELEAERLIALGLAAPVEEQPDQTAEGPQEISAPPVPDADTPDPDKEQGTEGEGSAADPGENEGEEDEVDFSKLTMEELKTLCKDAGIDIKGLNSKAKLIAAYEAQALPDLTAEAPV